MSMEQAQWDIAAEMYKRAGNDGGWTMCIDGDSDPDHGHSVGGNPSVPELVIPGFRDMPGPLVIQQITRYLDKITSTGGGWSGGWVRDDGALVLDSPSIIVEREAAIALGREREEDAIYCLHTGETITL